MENLRILVCDDHRLIRQGLITDLESIPGFFVVAEAENGYEMIAQYEKHKPDLVISDIQMPPLDGTAALKQLKLKYPEVKALFVSVHLGEVFMRAVKKVGGYGLIGKGSTRGELQFAVNEVMNGRMYYGPGYTAEQLAAIFEKYDDSPKPITLDLSDPPTEGEHKVLMLVGEGDSCAEIAKKLSISPRTVETYRQNIMKKYGIMNHAKLVVFAVKYVALMENEKDTDTFKPQM